MSSSSQVSRLYNTKRDWRIVDWKLQIGKEWGVIATEAVWDLGLDSGPKIGHKQDDWQNWNKVYKLVTSFLIITLLSYNILTLVEAGWSLY